MVSAIVKHKKVHETYNAQGELHGPGPSFAEHLASAEGQKELRNLQARIDAHMHGE